ncbi:MAG: alpha/beta hydrolase [Limnohabitans sp.]|nr:alpha/beta hydrolase [Limnohabitans sp.]
MKKIIITIVLTIVSFVTNAQNNPSFEVKVVGKGQPMILIPGYSCNGEVWNETVAQFKNQYEFHILTLAGFGGAKPIQTENILQTIKEDIAKYVLDKKLKKPMLMGHSLGAFMTLWLEADYPTLFGKGICVDGVPFISALLKPETKVADIKDSPMYNKEAVVNNFKNLPNEGYIENMTKMMGSQVADVNRAKTIAVWSFNSDRVTLGSTIVEMALTDLRDKIATIQQPILVLVSGFGRNEKSLQDFENQFAKISNKTIKTVPNAKHFIMYDAPEWFYNEITVFLNSKA